MYKLSFVIPVYNRPQEVKELLESFASQTYAKEYEIVIIEDGSTVSSQDVVNQFPQLPVSYYYKKNSGPGPSRNYGMQKAMGDYYIILDSDCILPPHYIDEVLQELNKAYTDFFGGPDAAHNNFTPLQKAINYAMTAFMTTGGIRGHKAAAKNFQPRSFNMGISKKAFEASQGFGKIHPGEDPDLTIRLWNKGFTSRFFAQAYVYHKRRISWSKFYKQVRKFGLVRPILNCWHPATKKLIYWFPTLFILGFIISIILAVNGYSQGLYIYGLYFFLVFIESSFKNKNIGIGLFSIWAVCIQFLGYGLAFLQSTFYVSWLKKDPQKQFPHLFFK